MKRKRSAAERRARRLADLAEVTAMANRGAEALERVGFERITDDPLPLESPWGLSWQSPEGIATATISLMYAREPAWGVFFGLSLEPSAILRTDELEATSRQAMTVVLEDEAC